MWTSCLTRKIWRNYVFSRKSSGRFLHGQPLKTCILEDSNFWHTPKDSLSKQPGRPVVSSVNSHTEKLSAYVDEFLRPLPAALPSYTKDTTDFIKRLRRMDKVPKDSILVTLDVSSLYTNIDTEEGLVIVEEELTKAGQNQPSAKTLTWLLDKVLKLNNFTFNNHNFIQVKGTAMGTRAAPNYANVYMGRLEDRFVYRTQWYNHIIDWIRFIDDIFLIWKEDSDSLNAFIEHLNSVVPSIKFTHEISFTSVNFLDTKVMKDRLEQRIGEYSEYFVACGYKRNKVLTEMNNVLKLTQEESLQLREKGTNSRIPLVTKYNLHTSFISGIANRNWHFLQSKERLAKLFKERPLVAYRRPKSLRDMLVSSKLRSKTTKDKANTDHGCGPCNKPRCSPCLLIEKTTTFTGTNQGDRTFDILHTVNW